MPPGKRSSTWSGYYSCDAVIIDSQAPRGISHESRAPQAPVVMLYILEYAVLLFTHLSPHWTEREGSENLNSGRTVLQSLLCCFFSIWFLESSSLQEKEMATHSNTLAWKIPWTEEPGRLQSMGRQRVRHDWATSFHSLHSLHALSLEKEMATHSGILAWGIPWSEETGGSWPMGSQRVGHDWSD